MAVPLPGIVALLLVVAGCHAAPESQKHGSWSQAPQHHSPAELPPPLDSLACTLAGGWCPAHEVAPPRSQCAAGDCSNESGNGTEPGRHNHKALWPLNHADWAGLSFAVLALLLAATGGIGGGAILVPIYLMILGFSTSGAVALSNVTIVGGTLANLAFNTVRTHPLHPERPLIDWSLVMVMEPSTILGAVAGGYVNKVLPAWLTTVTLCLLLVVVTYKMLQKAIDIRNKERLAQEASLSRLSALDAEGGDFAGSIPIPLLQPLLHHEHSPPVGSFTPASPNHVPSPPTPGSPEGRSSSRGSNEGSPSSAADAALAASRPTDSVSREAHVDLEAGAGLKNGESGPMQRVSSQPVPIGQAGSRALPMLSPVGDQHEAQLGSGERNPLLVQADGTPLPLPLSPFAKDGLAHTSSSGSLAGKTWPYKEAQWSGKNGSSGHAAHRRRWRPHVPWGKLAVLLLLLTGVVAFDILKSMAPCPSLSYWLRATAMVPVTVITLLGVRSYLLRKDREARAAGYVPLEGDVHWTPRSTLVYPALCTIAGLCAGIFGVGGGIVKGPLMLEMGVLPEVAAATSATMIWFTSCSASVVFISFGAVQWDYAAACFTLGLVSTVVGQLIMIWVSRHLRSRSLLVFLMAAVLGLSCFALAIQDYQATLAAARSGSLWEFHDICGRVA